MEKYTITFIMTDGTEIVTEEERESKNDFFFSLKRYDSKWYKSKNTIINLDNVNSIILKAQSDEELVDYENEKELRNVVW
ncbi:hypothetical protein J32TS6_05390 [Virgibacillus pantothenticus]|uniref:Uncharacterized protein n=1 Tax=Virgibacillus pantothenticus TaxID=1473 RepID=A0A0L0QNU6_VIRPA|nr:hypothetical protein [Virgibacillus pantothenticus]KNE20262.1 hypothetical protein AFK71_17900 [Virgibacillus pantothenticus]MED3735813.1 hypothetical protein [Virgibacillus pantothenticus]QTY17988.1 hypothetical protein KBP50_09295 [Virgibacillus pantothenticus]SIS55563.1 hypothetical protein SAMN05421787_101362 [Virgibacillus pantothenticus]GIP61984.1 hypothetical protein J32TS6_05390 [Virgibacillus pantothenticus]